MIDYYTIAAKRFIQTTMVQKARNTSGPAQLQPSRARLQNHTRCERDSYE